MGFPTPNTAPDTTGCRVFIIPSDEEWFALFMGAVYRLTYESAWYQNGDLTPAEAAAAWVPIIDAAYDRSELGTCDVTIPSPWWDEESADDSDDTSDILEQPWYGDLVLIDGALTFVENAFIWTVAGFI